MSLGVAAVRRTGRTSSRQKAARHTGHVQRPASHCAGGAEPARAAHHRAMQDTHQSTLPMKRVNVSNLKEWVSYFVLLVIVLKIYRAGTQAGPLSYSVITLGWTNSFTVGLLSAVVLCALLFTL